MWNKIVNPKTGRKVNVNSNTGEKILRNYMKQLGGSTGEQKMRAGEEGILPTITINELYDKLEPTYIKKWKLVKSSLPTHLYDFLLPDDDVPTLRRRGDEVDLSNLDLTNIGYNISIVKNKYLNVQGSNLSGLDLSGFYFSNIQGANFEGSVLKNTHFRDDTLQSSILTTIPPKGIDWSRADLKGGKLTQKKLVDILNSDKNFSHKNLSGLNFNVMDLRGANFEGANLQGANLQGANFQGANLQGANLQGVHLRGTMDPESGGNLANNIANRSGKNVKWNNLPSGRTFNNFQYVNLLGANLRGAQIQGVDFSFSNLENVNLQDSNIAGTNFSNSNLQGANLIGAHITKTNFKNSILIHANLSRCRGPTNWHGIRCRYGGFDGSERDRETEYIYFENANLRDVYLKGSNLAYGYFINANLQGANLENANLQNANLGNANLQGANLQGANVLYIHLKGANIEGITGNVTNMDQLHPDCGTTRLQLQVQQQEWRDKSGAVYEDWTERYSVMETKQKYMFRLYHKLQKIFQYDNGTAQAELVADDEIGHIITNLEILLEGKKNVACINADTVEADVEELRAAKAQVRELQAALQLTTQQGDAAAAALRSALEVSLDAGNIFFAF